jgi:hypothetical protein
MQGILSLLLSSNVASQYFFSRMSMQAEKPEDPVEENKEEDDDEEEEVVDGPHVLLLASNDSDDEPMMKAYEASVVEMAEKEKNMAAGFKKRGNNGYGLDYSPDGLIPGQEPLAYAQPSQPLQVFGQQPVQATHHPTTGSLLPMQRGLLQRPMVMPPQPMYPQHPSWSALEAHKAHKLQIEQNRLMSQQQHQQLQELSELHQRNLANNVARQLHLQRQYEANLPPARPPKKNATVEKDDTEDEVEDTDDSPMMVTERKKKKKKKKKKSQKSQSGLGGDMKFKQDEVEYLMECMENILPMGKVEWDKLAERYNKRFPSRPRKMVNLRNQFNTYAKAKPPTGDPDCPPLVSRAKRIVELTKEKAGLEVLNDPKKLAKCDVPTVNGSTKDVDGIAAQLSSDPKKVVSSKKKRRSPVDTDAFVDALLASEQAQAKREERMERRRQEDRNETFRLAITAMTSIAAAVTGREVPAVTALPATVAKKRSIGSSDSSSDSEDSPRTKGRRFKGRLKKYTKKTSLEVTTKEGNDDDGDSSTSELESRAL